MYLLLYIRGLQTTDADQLESTSDEDPDVKRTLKGTLKYWGNTDRDPDVGGDSDI